SRFLRLVDVVCDLLTTLLQELQTRLLLFIPFAREENRLAFLLARGGASTIIRSVCRHRSISSPAVTPARAPIEKTVVNAETGSPEAATNPRPFSVCLSSVRGIIRGAFLECQARSSPSTRHVAPSAIWQICGWPVRPVRCGYSVASVRTSASKRSDWTRMRAL